MNKLLTIALSLGVFTLIGCGGSTTGDAETNKNKKMNMAEEWKQEIAQFWENTKETSKETVDQIGDKLEAWKEQGKDSEAYKNLVKAKKNFDQKMAKAGDWTVDKLKDAKEGTKDAWQTTKKETTEAWKNLQDAWKAAKKEFEK